MADKKSLFGIKIDAVNKNEIVRTLLKFSEGDGKRTAFYVNAHCVNTAFFDCEYRDILNHADLVYAGGMGVVWAAQSLGVALPERVNILDFLDRLVEGLRGKGTRIFLLGGTQGVIKKTENLLKDRGLNIVGSRNGFFNKTEESGILKEINLLKPDILIVGMGVPKQEKWIARHLNELDVNLCWGVGAAFEWISGHVKRSPLWMRANGLEWLHRFCQHPGRLWKRYVFGNPLFVYRVFKEKFTRK